MKNLKKPSKKAVAIIIISVILLLLLSLTALIIYGRMQMGKIPDLTFEKALDYTLHDAPKAVITVGIIKDGQSSYTVYGENGVLLSPELHAYEIGSVTKTMTAALINKAVREEKLDIDDTIDKYLDLPAGNNYPAIKELLTHTSGYKGYYLEKPMISNRLNSRNDFCGVTKEMVLDRLGKLNRTADSYGFEYSNFGYAILGLVLEAVYDNDYTSLLNDFTRNELGLKNTHISTQDGDLGNYWDWRENDAYLPAGAVTSDIEDMLRYAELQLEDDTLFSDCHNSLKTIDASSDDYKMMGINMDDIGMAWIIDNENNIVWHNGATGDYNSYLGFDPEKNTAVVILSNCSPNYRIPATVLGVKLISELNENT